MKEEFMLWSDGLTAIFRCECCGELGMQLASRTFGLVKDGHLRESKYPATLALPQEQLTVILRALAANFPQHVRPLFAEWDGHATT